MCVPAHRRRFDRSDPAGAMRRDGAARRVMLRPARSGRLFSGRPLPACANLSCTLHQYALFRPGLANKVRVHLRIAAPPPPSPACLAARARRRAAFRGHLRVTRARARACRARDARSDTDRFAAVSRSGGTRTRFLASRFSLSFPTESRNCTLLPAARERQRAR